MQCISLELWSKETRALPGSLGVSDCKTCLESPKKLNTWLNIEQEGPGGQKGTAVALWLQALIPPLQGMPTMAVISSATCHTCTHDGTHRWQYTCTVVMYTHAMMQRSIYMLVQCIILKDKLTCHMFIQRVREERRKDKVELRLIL